MKTFLLTCFVFVISLSASVEPLASVKIERSYDTDSKQLKMDFLVIPS